MTERIDSEAPGLPYAAPSAFTTPVIINRLPSPLAGAVVPCAIPFHLWVRLGANVLRLLP